MKEKLKEIEALALKKIEEAQNSEAIEEIRIKFLGKKGELTTILRSMGNLSKEERPIMGKMVNDVKKVVEDKIEAISTEIKNKEKQSKLKNEIIDVTLPGNKSMLGNRHPLEL